MENNTRAQKELETALAADDENPFAYHQLAITYARQGNEGMAALSTAERYYRVGDLAGAASFAGRASQKLEKGTPAWQRASDILNVARNVREDRGRRSFAELQHTHSHEFEHHH
jgi:predicted Zn-dependent protease